MNSSSATAEKEEATLLGGEDANIRALALAM